MKESSYRSEDVSALLWSACGAKTLEAAGGQVVGVVSTGRDSRDALYRHFVGAEITVGGVRMRGKVVVLSDSSMWTGLPFELRQGTVLVVVADSGSEVVCDYDGEAIPVVHLAAPPELEAEVESLTGGSEGYACGDYIREMDSVHRTNLFDRLLLERLERKYNDILRIHDSTGNNWSETFHIMLFRSMGTNYNKEALERLARTVPYVTVCREKGSASAVEALLLGAAGLLERAYPDDYVRMLQKEYEFLARKHSITALRAGIWRNTGVNPLNSPVIRIAQIASLLSSNDFIFDQVRKCRTIADVRKLFGVTASQYWDSHVVPGRVTFSIEPRRVGDIMVDLLAINLVVPMLFAYGNLNREPELKDVALEILGNIHPENNVYMRAWAGRGVVPGNAYESQALLQLNNEYCRRRRCCDCPVGRRRLKPLMDVATVQGDMA